MNLAGIQCEIDPAKSFDAAEALRDRKQFEDG
jgi:hypothetical protein